MGDAADLILEGVVCERCGELIDEDHPCYNNGVHPVLCDGCEDEDKAFPKCEQCGSREDVMYDEDGEELCADCLFEKNSPCGYK